MTTRNRKARTMANVRRGQVLAILAAHTYIERLTDEQLFAEISEKLGISKTTAKRHVTWIRAAWLERNPAFRGSLRAMARAARRRGLLVPKD
jgi:hypothetical protein